MIQLAPHLVPPSPNWQPREAFSPTQLARFGDPITGCVRQWALSYLWGVRVAKKAKGAMFGAVIHASLEAYLAGGKVTDFVISPSLAKELVGFSTAEQQEMIAKAPDRALAGIHLLPNLKECDAVEIEQWINVDSRRVVPELEPIVMNGKIDLRFSRAGQWYQVDHKSTKGRKETGKPFDPWAYAKTADEIANDPQGVFYSLDTIQKHNLTSLWNRWAYYLTDPKHHPRAKAVDFEAHRADVEAKARGWYHVASNMRDMIRRPPASLDDIPPPAVLPPDPASPCNAFGGCPYSYTRGGPCNPHGAGGVKLGHLILTAADVPAHVKGLIDMEQSLADKIAQNKAMNGGGSPLLPPEAYQGPASPSAVSGVFVNPQASHATFIMPPAAAPAAPIAAPVEPPLPEGWTRGANGVPVPPLPEGWRYSASGTPELIPVQVALPVVVAPAFSSPDGIVWTDNGVINNDAGEPVQVGTSTGAEPKKRRGRPAKVKAESPEVNGGLSSVPASHFDEAFATPNEVQSNEILTVGFVAKTPEPVTARTITTTSSTLTDRDYFAMSALSGLCANPARLQEDNAGYAYDLADAMLEARK